MGNPKVFAAAAATTHSPDDLAHLHLLRASLFRVDLIKRARALNVNKNRLLDGFSLGASFPATWYCTQCTEGCSRLICIQHQSISGWNGVRPISRSTRPILRRPVGRSAVPDGYLHDDHRRGSWPYAGRDSDKKALSSPRVDSWWDPERV